MLRRLRVRTRLLTVVAVPLALLLVIAVQDLLDRRAAAVDADRIATLAQAAADVGGAAEAIEAERVLAAAQRAGAGSPIPQSLEAQRRVTDAAVDRARAALEAVVTARPELTASLRAAEEALDDLGELRGTTAVARSRVPWTDDHAPVIGALLQVEEDLAATVRDAGAAGELTEAVLVARAREAASAQDAVLATALVWGDLASGQLDALAELRADELGNRTAYLATSSASLRVARRTELQQSAVVAAGRQVDDVVASRSLEPAAGLGPWLETSSARHQKLHEVHDARVSEMVDSARQRSDRLRQESLLAGVAAAAGFLAALVLALLATRSITIPLRRLTEAADDLAEQRLPQLVDALRHPGEDDERYLSATVELLDAGSDDELGHLSRAFNEVQLVAVNVAAEQSTLLRKGISDLFVNLARRNQALIERQIKLLDQLEAGEQDPEVLEHLYALDHLATRMRRNAESLLVLAGAESGPRRTQPVSAVDVVRAALSEVEAYDRVDLGTITPATIQGAAVSDVAHILAELLENATHYSAPTTKVRVEGSRTGGSYQVMIVDHGIGLSVDQLDALNAGLRDPPVTGLALGRSLGCLVAARLAARHGITVRLRATSEGVTAYVILPRHLIAEDPAEGSLQPALRAGRLASLAPGAAPASPPPSAPAAPPAAVAAPSLAAALPSRAELDDSLRTILDDVVPATLVEPPVEDDGPDDVEPTLVAAGGLTRRVRGASVVDDRPVQSGTTSVRRSPDEVRSLLSQYRAGLDAGRAASTRAPEGEGA